MQSDALGKHVLLQAFERSACYYKYESFPELRDSPPTDNLEYCFKMSEEVQCSIWNVILPEGTFASNIEDLKAEIRQENIRGWRAYGPDTHGQSEDNAITQYQQVRVQGFGNTDATEYTTFQRWRMEAKGAEHS